MAFVIFYSWQSDLPNRTNRGLIGDALENTATALQRDEAVSVEPVVDRDTAGVPGAPDIALTIFGKIDRCQLFVGDVSLVNPDAGGRRTPNPNVLVELGYALKALGPERVVLVMNTAFGGHELLPFDLRMRRVLAYNSPPDAAERAAERRGLERSLDVAVRSVIEHHVRAAPAPVSEPALADRVTRSVAAAERRQDSLTRAYMGDLAARLGDIAPDLGAAEAAGTELDEALVTALGKTTDIIAEFDGVCHTIAENDASSAAEALYQGFGRILDRYELPSGFSGVFRSVDFDFFHFVGHEMFVTFFAALIENNRWATIGHLLAEPIYVERDRQGLAAALGFTEISRHVALLDHRNRRLGLNRIFLHADLLNQRHTTGPLAEATPITAFTDADYFLFLRTELPPDAPLRSWDWAPWSALYLGSRPPRFLLTAQKQERAARIAAALGVEDVERLRERLRERGNKVQEMFRHAHNLAPLLRIDLATIGSR